MKRKLIPILLCLATFVSFAQEKIAADAYVEYFKNPREGLYMHTNKTTFLPGEEIWFKVYTYDRKSHLTSKATTNIHLGLFDKEGKQIDQKLVLAKSGFAHGSIAIDSTFASGNYFLKVWTNWMKNFKEDDAFIKQIKVLNPESEEEVNKISETEYDIQFLPEGGYMLTDVKNIIGFKAIDDTGKGSETSGVILDENDAEVASFSSNPLGLGRFSFTPESGRTYRAKVTLDNGKEAEIPLPKSKEKGINLHVNNLNPKNVVITLSTNQKSFDVIFESSYELLVHKDGASKTIPINFMDLQKKIAISKKDLFKGINTVTLFDQDQNPIAERMFFNEALLKEHNISINKVGTDLDSVAYSIKTVEELPVDIHASISVLPKGTKSYNPKHNIFSAFYLKPHLKGTVENPAYYFTDMNRKKRFELDVLLMTQGWSRYSWNDIFNKAPEMTFPFESGLTISGAVNDSRKYSSFLMYPSKLHNSINLNYDEQGKFNIENLYLIKGEYLAFSAFGKNGKAIKPRIAMSFPQNIATKEEINVSDYQYFSSFYTNKNNSFNGFVTQKRDVLDEIVISSTLEKKKRKQYRLKTSGKIYGIDRETDKRYVNISQFLDNQGFAINYNIGILATPEAQAQGGVGGGGTGGVAGVSIKHLNPNKNPVVIFLDNIQLTDYNIVAYRSLHEFEDIYIDDTYNANLVSVAGSVAIFVTVIKLFTRKTPMEINSARPPMQQVVKVPYGFEPQKEFYAPKYGSFSSDLFREVGVIDWKPNVKITNSENNTLNIFDTGIGEMTFYIEGISTDGDLISQIVHVK